MPGDVPTLSSFFTVSSFSTSMVYKQKNIIIYCFNIHDDVRLIFHVFNINDPMTIVPADWNFNIFSLLSHIIWISTAVSDNGSLWTNVSPMKEGKTALRDFFGFQCDIFSLEGGNPWVEWMDQRPQGRVGRPKWLKGWSKYVHLNLPPFQPTQSLPSTNQGSKPENIWGRSKEEWMIYP